MAVPDPLADPLVRGLPARWPRPGPQRAPGVGVLGAIVLTAACCAAQAASSAGFFLASQEHAAGGTARSATFGLAASFGAPAGEAQSATWRLRAGVTAQLDAPVTGRPWLTGASPLHVKLRSGAPLTLHGTELQLGPNPVLTIGGRPAAVVSRTNAAITTNAPLLGVPGWQPVTLQSPAGDSGLTAGVGVLPLLELPVPAQSLVPFVLRYRGTSNDQVAWCLSLGALPFALALPPFWHGLELDPATLLVLPVLPVARGDGLLELALPAVQLTVPIHVQAFVFSSDPGYAPGSFTNRVKL